MADGLNYLLGTIYAVGYSLTALFLMFWYGPKLLRFFFRNLPKTVMEWLLLPVMLAVTLFAVVVGLGLASFVWPLTAGIILREFLHKREKALKAQTDEYEGLLGEIRGDREEADPSTGSTFA